MSLSLSDPWRASKFKPVGDHLGEIPNSLARRHDPSVV
ncbi:hypothetical protein AERO9AM_20894 [Aeromicrobium sp. 9AM]|nr:hypothetical protein AERO9AM_20894 [Aeromicrobium sp. 9AM]